MDSIVEAPEILIDWAEKWAVGLQLVYDRPWKPTYIATAPEYNRSVETTCCTVNPTLKLRRYLTQDGESFLYLGQCSRCQCIRWNYAVGVVKKQSQNC